ncbi:MAG: adenosylcobinamide-phosphate synthase CbiB [Rhodobacteraceae bacterium]|nr:adenosylcobinamide-phosphate synthase CbiB [Paracoccaceae bacterium]
MIALALVLDALFGEPKWLWDRFPHPAVVIGRAIGRAEFWLNNGEARKAKGVLLVVGLLIVSLLIGGALSWLPWPLQAVIAAILLAQRSLADHVQAVADALRLSSSDGRQAVAMIVGRDTAEMDASAVARSAIESAAENLSDGVTAPLFWLAIGGLPGMIAYKAINTADSMIGYRTPRHEEFGWAAARLDDLVNLIPARLTALLILLTQGGLRHWREVRREAPLHRSPNAGWPESALARSQGIALSGPRTYEGELRDFPFVNGSGKRSLAPTDIETAINALWRVWAACLALALIYSHF